MEGVTTVWGRQHSTSRTFSWLVPLLLTSLPLTLFPLLPRPQWMAPSTCSSTERYNLYEVPMLQFESPNGTALSSMVRFGWGAAEGWQKACCAATMLVVLCWTTLTHVHFRPPSRTPAGPHR